MINTFQLPEARSEILQQIQNVFESIAIEGHIFGSLARGTADVWSDIDIWLVFKNEDIQDVLKKRREYYDKLGEVVHIVEPPQNSPIEGIQSAVLYKTKVGLLMLDYYLCPLATAFITTESKKIFGGIELPLGEAGFNPQKVLVTKAYRIDFFISFIFNGIKKIARKDYEGFANIVTEYGYLSERYDIPVAPLTDTAPSFKTLEQMIANIQQFADEKQRRALDEIGAFMEQVKLSQ